MRKWLFHRVEVRASKVPVGQIGSRAMASTVMMDTWAIGVLLTWLPRFSGSFGAFDNDRAHGFGRVNRRRRHKRREQQCEPNDDPLDHAASIAISSSLAQQFRKIHGLATIQ
ncbi:MAG: hypothetical protein J0G94_13550 [Sphingomonadales bacterium]|nr:hypothetical protein [Sphingomonadales bacterium]